VIDLPGREVKRSASIDGAGLGAEKPLAPMRGRSHLMGAGSIQPGAEARMTQTSNRFLDEMARLLNDAAGVAEGVRREVQTLVQSQAERILRDMDVVTREEFEAVKEMAAKAREENERLAARLAEVEKRLAK
jgi:BMFP domain-containing protein YqiC